jgi:hypothetical protein
MRHQYPYSFLPVDIIRVKPFVSSCPDVQNVGHQLERQDRAEGAVHARPVALLTQPPPGRTAVCTACHMCFITRRRWLRLRKAAALRARTLKRSWPRTTWCGVLVRAFRQPAVLGPSRLLGVTVRSPHAATQDKDGVISFDEFVRLMKSSYM